VPEPYECYGYGTSIMDLNNQGVEVGTYSLYQDNGTWCYIRNGEWFYRFRVVETQPCRVNDVDESAQALAGSHQLPDGREQGWV
jgi:hypothetical protein